MALATLLLSGLCVRLGLWQWHRMESKQDAVAAMDRQLRHDPVPLREPFTEYQRVTVTGHFLPDKEVTVKFRVRDGAPGVDVVTPLVQRDGAAVLIDRGWMASGNDDRRPAHIPAPPAGRVTIEGWWRPDSRAARHAVEPTGGQVRAISSRGLADHVGLRLVRGYVNQQQPRTLGLMPEPKPRVSSALNFFYALQWWFFGTLALCGIPWLAFTGGSANRGRSSPAPAST